MPSYVVSAIAPVSLAHILEPVQLAFENDRRGLDEVAVDCAEFLDLWGHVWGSSVLSGEDGSHLCRR